MKVLTVAVLLLALAACEPAADGNLATTVSRERSNDDRSLILTATVDVQSIGQSQDGPFVGMTPALVTNVVDGDTIDVLIAGTEYRVRYIGVDTPETVHPTRGEEPYGREASEFNT